MAVTNFVDIMKGLLDGSLTLCMGTADCTDGTTLEVKTGLKVCKGVIANCNAVAAGTPHDNLTVLPNTNQTSKPGVIDATAVGATGTTVFNYLAWGTKNL